MVIDGGYYISERTSNEKPYAHIDTGVLYLPFDVGNNEAEEGGYAFREYRVTVPITDDIPADVLKQVIAQVPDVRDAINDTLIAVFGNSASIKKTSDYKTAIEATKEKISDEILVIYFITNERFPIAQKHVLAINPPPQTTAWPLSFCNIISLK